MKETKYRLPPRLTFCAGPQTCFANLCLPATKFGQSEYYLFRLQLLKPLKIDVVLLETDVALGTALVDMYAKCGMLAKTTQVLEEIPIRDVISWSALIAGYGHQRRGYEALKCFERMQSEGIAPNEITFLSVLSACSRSGLVDEAQRLFHSMIKKHGITPSLEHHTCLIVVFGCAGMFDQAISVIKVTPSPDSLDIWVALLGTCKKWGNVKLARLAFDQVLQIDSTCAAGYVLMSNIFVDNGFREDARKVEEMRLKYCS